MASGLASTPSSWTDLPALPSSSFASTIDWVVSGQTVVHSESSKDSMTTRPRNWLSDIGWPNWFVSWKSGAALLPSGVPRSRLGFSIAAALAGLSDEPGDAAEEAEEERPATARAAASARPPSHLAGRVIAVPRGRIVPTPHRLLRLVVTRV